MFEGIELDIIERDEAGMLVRTGTKVFAPAEQPLSKWVNRPKGTVVRPPMNGWAVYEKKACLDKVSTDALVYIVFKGNDVQNSNFAVLTSGPNQNGHGWSVTPDNFRQSMVCFAARKLVKPTWLNDRDEFNVPNTEHPAYEQFALDAVVYALFHGSNQTSSLPNVTYKDETYDIPNHFFWLTPDFVKGIKGLPRPLYVHANKAETPFVAAWLEENRDKLSADALAVLDAATGMVVESARHRVNAKPQYHLNDRWDAGWYQIRMGLFGREVAFESTKSMIAAYDDCKVAYKKLLERMRPLIYELGMLPRERALS